MQHCLLRTGKTSGTAGATALTGLLTSNTGPLPVVEAIATGVLTAATSQNLQRVSAGHTVPLCGAPAACTGLMTGCTGVVVLVEAISTGGHAVAMLHQEGRLAGRALQCTRACGALRLAS